jgi:hypothetical protein
MTIGCSETDRWWLVDIYREFGSNWKPPSNSEQSGVHEVFQRLSSGRLKVFQTLARFWQEYPLNRRDAHGHVVRENDLLMNRLQQSVWS